MRIVIAMTGATGTVLGVRLLENLAARPDIETHLVISRWGRATIDYETDRTPVEVEKLADAVYKPDDMYAPISSGSFTTDATIVVPCSMKTVAAIRAGYSDGLIARAADVTLKERRMGWCWCPEKHRCPRFIWRTCSPCLAWVRT